MDIHKPKAAHSLREFAIEIGTIICGILIALGLEQGVEWVHTRRDVEETREALGAEIGTNVGNAVYSAEQGKCQIVWAKRFIAWAHGAPRPNTPPPIGTILSSTVWDSARSGAVLRMPLEERAKFANYYSLVDDTKLLDRQLRDALLRAARYTQLQQLNAAQAISLEEEMNAVIRVLAGEIAEDGLAIHRAPQYGVELRVGVPDSDEQEARHLIEQLCGSVGAPKPNFTPTGDLRSVWETYAQMAADRPASEPAH